MQMCQGFLSRLRGRKPCPSSWRLHAAGSCAGRANREDRSQAIEVQAIEARRKPPRYRVSSIIDASADEDFLWSVAYASTAQYEAG